jgi:hypothetical protein
MVISAFVRPLHAVLVHHSRYQSIQDDILPSLVGRWWFASGNSCLCFQQYFASRAEAVSAVLNLTLGGELVPALVAAPCGGLREFGVAVIAIATMTPTGTVAWVTEAGACTFLASIPLPPMLADAGTSTFFANTVTPPVRTDTRTSTIFAITVTPPMRTRFMLVYPFRF